MAKRKNLSRAEHAALDKKQERPSIHEELQTSSQNWATSSRSLKKAMRKQIARQMGTGK